MNVQKFGCELYNSTVQWEDEERWMFVYVTRVYNIAAIDFYIGYSYMQSVLGAPDTFSPHPMASRFYINLFSVLCR